VRPCAHSIFHPSPARRVALARERFFEEGVRPTGLTSEAVIQSWVRCLGRHRDTRELVEFEPVTSSRAHHALQRNRDLVAAWGLELPQLQAVLGATSCSAILTDASGVVIAATPAGQAHERLMPVAHRVGVNLSEEAVGTTAPGLAAKTGRPVAVLGGEHYFDAVQTMHCAAAPILNVAGQLTGVIDISSEALPFGFDATALVKVYAGLLENRLLAAQSAGLLVLRLQVHPTLLGTPVAALVAVDTSGKIVWANRSAARLLGIPIGQAGHDAVDAVDAVDAEEAFDLRLGQLASLSQERARLVVLPNGLSVWIRAESAPWSGVAQPGLAAGPAAAGPMTEPEVIAANPTASPLRNGVQEDIALRARDRDLIASVLDECRGNVSRAAKRLRVSRGLIYRRLKADRQAEAS
jgi:sigma-54 dependent transcriptional regulator, acetoin dehydrogenase operon transcriptional activator AcoR